MIPSPGLLPDALMPAPQRPTRRAPQMRKTVPSRAAQVQRRAADAIHPASGQAASRPTLPATCRIRVFPATRRRTIPHPHFSRMPAVPTHPRSPRPASVPRADSDFSPRTLLSPCSPRSIPRAFSCAFPALLPDSVPPFCASFVKNRNKLHAVAQSLRSAAHLRALLSGLRRNFPATPSAGHGLPT